MKHNRKRYLRFIMVLIVAVVFSGATKINAITNYTTMKVNYIDVGESDSVLIQSDGKNMLIDAGDKDDKNTILGYLKSKKIKTIDYFILTHPHEDHISIADEVIRTYKIGKVIMPAVTHTTQAYENVLKAVKAKGLKITKPVVGTKYKIGKANFTILAPNNYKYGSNLNNYSVAIKLVNGKNSFIFIGDNETEAIKDILANKINIDADVLMCGHHGSKTSTTSDLLKAVTPTYAIISVGKNSYGHPSSGTLKLLQDTKVKTYRTDENGTITATSTGTKITFNAKETVYKQQSVSTNTSIVYYTKTGKKYHLINCSYLTGSKIKTTVKEAKAKGLTPCSRCNPPK